MNERELNKKLAEWAGFYQKTHDNYWGDLTTVWHHVSGRLTDYGYGNSPNIPFTKSLDACFKWLVPQPTDIHFKKTTEYPDHIISEVNCWLYVEGKMYQGWSYNPALALCLAIEKLIDEGEASTVSTATVVVWGLLPLMAWWLC